MPSSGNVEVEWRALALNSSGVWLHRNWPVHFTIVFLTSLSAVTNHLMRSNLKGEVFIFGFQFEGYSLPGRKHGGRGVRW